jgi:hypothetical protein
MFIFSGIDYLGIEKYLSLNLTARKVLKKHSVVLRIKDPVPIIFMAFEVLIHHFMFLYKIGFIWKSSALSNTYCSCRDITEQAGAVIS